MTDSGTDYREHLLERLQDKEEAAAYLNAVLEYADEPVLMLAIRDVVDAYGVRYVAKSAGLNRESLYRMLSEQGNPRLSSLFAVLKSIGLRLAVEIDQEVVSVTGYDEKDKKVAKKTTKPKRKPPAKKATGNKLQAER